MVSSSIWARMSSSSSAARLRVEARAVGLVGLGEQVDVGAQRGQRCTQLVAGVGDQAALALAGGVEGGQHLVERGRQPGDLVVALDRAAAAGPRCGRLSSTAVVSRRTGRRPLRATSQPAKPATSTPTAAEARSSRCPAATAPVCCSSSDCAITRAVPSVPGRARRRPGTARRRLAGCARCRSSRPVATSSSGAPSGRSGIHRGRGRQPVPSAYTIGHPDVGRTQQRTECGDLRSARERRTWPRRRPLAQRARRGSTAAASGP